MRVAIKPHTKIPAGFVASAYINLGICCRKQDGSCECLNILPVLGSATVPAARPADFYDLINHGIIRGLVVSQGKDRGPSFERIIEFHTGRRLVLECEASNSTHQTSLFGTFCRASLIIANHHLKGFHWFFSHVTLLIKMTPVFVCYGYRNPTSCWFHHQPRRALLRSCVRKQVRGPPSMGS